MTFFVIKSFTAIIVTPFLICLIGYNLSLALFYHDYSHQVPHNFEPYALTSLFIDQYPTLLLKPNLNGRNIAIR